MQEARHVILPGTGAQLLRRELALAFTQAGLRVTLVDPRHLQDPKHPQRLTELLDGEPALLFSVNFQGLYPLRPLLETLERGNGSAAVWCVDNPWNILAGVRDPRWKRLAIFVTDHSFIKPLSAHGAENVRHLPLAASFELFTPHAERDAAFPAPEDMAPFVFVGRSAFPGKENFFAGLDVPETLLDEAGAMRSQGQRPDVLWWERAMGLTDEVFWPGKKARRAALGAEEANLAWRTQCLAAAARAGLSLIEGKSAGRDCAAVCPGLDIFGDDGWQPLLPQKARLRSPVDYYARVPGIYAKARYSLCLTSLQLPMGLNQRHFDIWAAGGLALSDATPGLDLFPEELTRPITFRRAEDIAMVVEGLERARDARGLKADWQACIKAGHTYAHRVRTILERASSVK